MVNESKDILLPKRGLGPTFISDNATEIRLDKRLSLRGVIYVLLTRKRSISHRFRRCMSGYWCLTYLGRGGPGACAYVVLIQSVF